MKKITFKFYGALRRYCGKEIEIYGRTVNETMRSLCIQIPNLKRHMKYKKYNLKVGRRDVGQDEYIDGIDVEKDIVVRVIPVIHGAGPFALVAGAALAALSTASFVSAAVGAVLLQMGIGLMLSGAAALLTKQPKFNQDHQGVEDSKSSSFSNLSNMVGQGKQILRVYGEMLVAGYVISQGLSSRRIDAWGTDIKDVQSANYIRHSVDLIASTDPNGKTYNIDRNCDSVRNAAVNIQANWS
ncbi:tail assembly protein [Wohlfahrtiimonas populi]|uniref:tail assembly protein n=1 Tax=Wohlfahrtiimonas populi TaxID=1940240 RepID=UPI00098D704D|nr:tail assembly protein [Wohlfahrtiimonas populi]